MEECIFEDGFDNKENGVEDVNVKLLKSKKVNGIVEKDELIFSLIFRVSYKVVYKMVLKGIIFSLSFSCEIG